MGRGDLSDEEWARLEPHLPANRGRGGRRQCHRRVINGILFRHRTGLPWRDLPGTDPGRDRCRRPRRLPHRPRHPCARHLRRLRAPPRRFRPLWARLQVSVTRRFVAVGQGSGP
ncbi:transposase [Streptomyces sp. NPDC005728]|uniref:transposase n=1 Tax=Streptomyces sp. NPDC005728 TaxID=3157054 RepID=UPI0033ECCA75